MTEQAGGGGYERVRLGDPAGRTRWTVRHGDRELAVFVVGDRTYAVDALCPHRSGRLVEGLVRGDVLVCPSHWYRFELRTGRCLTTDQHTLPTYEVVVDGGSAWALVPAAKPARSWSEILRAHAAGST